VRIRAQLAEAVESAQETAGYEPEEDEKVTAATIKKALKELIDDLRGSVGESAVGERKRLTEALRAVIRLEERIKEQRAQLKALQFELDLKLMLKRVGAEDEKAESQAQIDAILAQIAELDPKHKEQKKRIAALTRSRTILQGRIDRADALLIEIGGQLTEAEAKALILKKLHDLIVNEQSRYLNAERRALIAVCENLWDKYAVSSRELEAERAETLRELDGLLEGLGYLG
jgi:type I restriction enzyme M protein